jgi:hypothetical protein
LARKCQARIFFVRPSEPVTSHVKTTLIVSVSVCVDTLCKIEQPEIIGYFEIIDSPSDVAVFPAKFLGND